MSESQKLISFILPIYNEEDNIPQMNTALLKTLKNLDKKYDFEVIYVNDGSSDNSLNLLKDIAIKNKKIKIISFSRNFSQQMAVTAGLDFCKGDAAIIMDADLQDPPEVSFELIKKWEEGFNVAYAVRRTRKDGFFKKLTAYIFYRFLEKTTKVKIPKDTGDFRLLDRKAIEAFKQMKEQTRFVRGMISYIGFKQVAVFFDRNERYAGVTKYNFGKLVKLAQTAVLSFSDMPTRVLFNSSLFLIFFSIFIAPVLFIILNLVSASLAAIAFYITAIFMLSIIILALGILGLYLQKIHEETLQRPLYIVDEVIN